MLIFCVCLFTQSLQSVFTETCAGTTILETLFDTVDAENARADSAWQDLQDRYAAKAERAAMLIDGSSAIRNRKWLQEASEIIGADYIVLFDSDGSEVTSDSQYRGMTLGKTEDSPTYDFRRLLRGAARVSRYRVKDAVSGETFAMLASFGLAGFAVSLGAQAFVSDIIAGLNVMLDGSYKVGDIIRIGDYTGKVLSINMRKTTVVDRHGSVRSLCNSEITNVINHSVYPYIFIMDFTLPQSYTVVMVESILERELPKLKGKCPYITDGPEYLGVSAAELYEGFMVTKVSIRAYPSERYASLNTMRKPVTSSTEHSKKCLRICNCSADQ